MHVWWKSKTPTKGNQVIVCISSLPVARSCMCIFLAASIRQMNPNKKIGLANLCLLSSLCTKNTAMFLLHDNYHMGRETHPSSYLKATDQHKLCFDGKTMLLLRQNSKGWCEVDKAHIPISINKDIWFSLLSLTCISIQSGFFSL